MVKRFNALHISVGDLNGKKMKNKNDCRQKENWVPWPCPLKAKYGDMGSNFMEIGAVAVNFNGNESPPFVISSRKVYLSFFFKLMLIYLLIPKSFEFQLYERSLCGCDDAKMFNLLRSVNTYNLKSTRGVEDYLKNLLPRI